MMPEKRDDDSAGSDLELDELVARIGCLYTRKGLSPPFHLREAARRWLGLDVSEIVSVVTDHLREHRRLYTCGSGDGHFWMVEAAVAAAWKAKHPVRSHVESDEPRLPRKLDVRPVRRQDPSALPPGLRDAFAFPFDDPEAPAEDDETDA